METPNIGTCIFFNSSGSVEIELIFSFKLCWDSLLWNISPIVYLSFDGEPLNNKESQPV